METRCNFFDERGRAIVAYAPPDRVLIETDAPFGLVDGRPVEPAGVGMALEHLSAVWGISPQEVASQLDANLAALTS